MTSRLAPPQRPLAANGSRNDAVARWAVAAQISLGLWLVVSCVQVLWSIQTFTALELWSLQPGDLSLSQPPGALWTLVLLVLAQLAVYLVSVALLLVWMAVARADRRLNRALLRGSTATTLLGWVVPVWRMRKSRRALTDLWHASDPGRSGDRPRTASRATPPLVLSYSLLRVLATAVAGLVVLRVIGAQGIADGLRIVVVALILGTGLLIAATVCLVLVIDKVTDQLRGRQPASGAGGTVRSVAASLMRA